MSGRVAVIGLGLMGGSLARALREGGGASGGGTEVVGFDADPSQARAALEAGAVDRVADGPADAARDADVTVLAAPLDRCVALVGELAGAGFSGVLTDVASLKAPIVAAARGAGVADRTVPGHPFVGGTGTGFAASRADLYRGAPVWLCDDVGGGEARSAVESLWRSVGADPRTTDAEAHDRRMVRASHLPQLAANALAAVLAAEGVGYGELGPGGRDAARLAASSPAMWRPLLAASASDLAPRLRAVAESLDGLAEALEAGEVETALELMESTRRWAGTAS